MGIPINHKYNYSKTHFMEDLIMMLYSDAGDWMSDNEGELIDSFVERNERAFEEWLLDYKGELKEARESFVSDNQKEFDEFCIDRYQAASEAQGEPEDVQDR